MFCVQSVVCYATNCTQRVSESNEHGFCTMIDQLKMKNKVIGTLESNQYQSDITSIHFAYSKYGYDNGLKIHKLHNSIQADDRTPKIIEIGKFLQSRNLNCIYSDNKNDSLTLIFCDETTLVTIGSNFNKDITISCTKLRDTDDSFELQDPFLDELDKLLLSFQENEGAHFCVLNKHKAAKSLGIGGQKLIRENYNESVLEGFDYLAEQFSLPKPFGRLALLQGVPGTGKTHLVRGLMSEIGSRDDLWLSIDADMLNQDDLNSILLEHTHYKKIFLLVEDADKSLVSRGSRLNVANLSNALNLTDGLVGELLNVRIIATTNAKSIEIDDALLRNGRLCKMIDVDLLKPERASKVYKRLTCKDKEYKTPVRLGDIYAKAFS